MCKIFVEFIQCASYLVELLDIPCIIVTIGENVTYFMYKYKIVYDD